MFLVVILIAEPSFSLSPVKQTKGDKKSWACTPLAVDSIGTRATNNLYRHNRDLPSFNVNNIRQPDLVPSELDKAPHPMMAPGQTLH